MDSSQSSVISFYDLSLVSKKILNDIKTNYEEKKELSDLNLIQLKSVYGDITEKAITLLENSEFVCYSTDNKKHKTYQVKGSSGLQYTVYPNVNFCECSAYKYQVCKTDPTHLTCKHVLAAKLAQITGKFKEEIVTNSSLVDTILLTLKSSTLGL